MLNKKAMALFLTLTFLVNLIPNVSTAGGCKPGYSPQCLDTDTLYCFFQENITAIDFHEEITSNYTETCVEGCNNQSLRCNDQYDLGGGRYDMAFMFFVMLFFLALACMICGYVFERVVLEIIAIIFFLVLAFQSFAFDTIFANTPFASLTWIFIILCWTFAIISFLLALYGVGLILKKEVEENREKGEMV